jgi:hypothetical protein
MSLNTQQTKGSQPSHDILAVSKGKNGKSYFTRIGVIFPFTTKKGRKGFSVKQELIGVMGQDVILLERSEDDDNAPQTQGANGLPNDDEMPF